MRALLLALMLALGAAPALAHKPSDAYLTLRPDGAGIAARWDIALRDLDLAIGLDADGDGAITWGELRARQGEIASLAASRLGVAGDGTACPPGPVTLRTATHGDGGYAVLLFGLRCQAAPARITVGYRLFAEIDPSHRGLLAVALPGGTRSAVLDPAAPPQEIALADGAGTAFLQFLAEGVTHILTGFDHLFFVAVLLLPAMLRREHGAWVPVDRFRDGLLETLKVLSAFSLAHTATVALAALRIVEPPSRIIESAIALTIVLAALDLIRPFLGRRRWVVAGAFGLIHGFGFAGALGPLDLPVAQLVVALVGFNLGVEAGQVMLALLVLPLSFALRRRTFYARAVLPLGSALAVAAGGLWFVARAFDWPAAGLGLLPI